MALHIDRSEYARLEQILEDLLAGTVSVLISPQADLEDGSVYHVTAYRLTPTGLRQRLDAGRATVLDALLATSSQEPLKCCARCRRDRGVSCFGLRPGAADGRRSYCLACDRPAAVA